MKKKTCFKCNGTGKSYHSGIFGVCPPCNGTGLLDVYSANPKTVRKEK